jgi:hypothetical protein
MTVRFLHALEVEDDGERLLAITVPSNARCSRSSP